MQFVIFHGSFGSPGSNWIPELRDQLEALGQVAIAPAFPVDTWEHVTEQGSDATSSKQNLDNWLAAFEPVYKMLDKDEPLCFIGHSLGPLFILHIVEKYGLQLDSAIFVCPFLEKLNKSWQIDNVNKSFYKTDFDFEKLRKLIPISYVLYSDNDPYVDAEFSEEFGKKLGSSMIIMRSFKHMNDDVHLTEFPLIIDLCISRVDLSLYQKFLDHYKRTSAQGYITSSNEQGVLKIKPEEVVDEGIFHFRHLKEDGFCTLYTGLQKFWDPESTYMKYNREAAGRVRSLIRVIVAEDKSDFENPILKKQVELDLNSGVKIYSVLWQDIKTTVKEPDFGIWDHNYVCIVRLDPVTKEVKEAELNSTNDDLSMYELWRNYILEKAKPIQSITELTT